MDFKKICINCMQEKDQNGRYCPKCGFDSQSYEELPHALKPLSILNGKYLLGRVIGAGGFGITYIALDLSLERVVAIKEFFLNGIMYRTQEQTTGFQTGSEMHQAMFELNMRKFEKEAQILARLKDLKGIVQVYDFFWENDTAYFVMEYIPGKTLKEYIKTSDRRVSFDEIYRKLRPVMQSLAEIHKNHILHRDISPDNMKLYDEHQLKLYDFGGARQSTSGEKSELSFRKKGYTPIEMYSSDGQQGPWTDVYAMAATIYFCITGKVPPESVDRAMQDNLQRPTELGAVISKGKEAVLLKALSLKASDRYQTMGAFIEELDKADSGADSTGNGKVKGKSSAPSSESRKKSGSNKIVIAAIVAAIAGVVAAAGMIATGVLPIGLQKVTQETLHNFENGSSAEKYLESLASSGFTVLMSVKEDGTNVEEIIDELEILGVNTNIFEKEYIQSYIGVIKTMASKQENDKLLELSIDAALRNAEDGTCYYEARSSKTGAENWICSPQYPRIIVGVQTDFSLDTSEGQADFHLVSSGYSKDYEEYQRGNYLCNGIYYEPSEDIINVMHYNGSEFELIPVQDTQEIYCKAEISYEGQNYALNENGINIVVFDEETAEVIDAVRIDPKEKSDDDKLIISR